MLPFFRALNPCSKHSGISYKLAHYSPCQGKEMLDSTVTEHFNQLFEKKLEFISKLNAIYCLLVGEHYDLFLKGREDCKGGAKGLLDFAIFPLLSRKLIAETFQHQNSILEFSSLLSYCIALPLECSRFGAAFSLTLLAAPFVATIDILNHFIEEREPEALLLEIN